MPPVHCVNVTLSRDQTLVTCWDDHIDMLLSWHIDIKFMTVLFEMLSLICIHPLVCRHVWWWSFGRWLQFVSSENTDWDNWTPPEGPSTSAAPPTDANHQWNEMHKYLISGSEKESSAWSLRLYKIFHIRQTEPRPGPGGTKKRKKCYWENCKICFYIYYEHFHGNWPDLALKLDLLPEEIKKILFWTGGLREVYNKYGIIHCLMQTNLI